VAPSRQAVCSEGKTMQTGPGGARFVRKSGLWESGGVP
jgi:hypothetical protein